MSHEPRCGYQALLAVCLCLCVLQGRLDGQSLTWHGVPLGDYVYVRSPSGSEIEGPLQAWTVDQVTLAGVTVDMQAGTQVFKRGDSRWNGLLWGFAAGLVLGSYSFPGYMAYDAVGAGSCRAGPRLNCAMATGAVIGLVGVLIDHLHVGRTLIHTEKKPVTPEQR